MCFEKLAQRLFITALAKTLTLSTQWLYLQKLIVASNSY